MHACNVGKRIPRLKIKHENNVINTIADTSIYIMFKEQLHYLVLEEEERKIKAAKTVAIVGPAGARWGRDNQPSQSVFLSMKNNVARRAMMYPINFTTNKGAFRYNAHDVPVDMDSSLLDLIFYGVDAIILMFDLESSDSFPDITRMHAHIKGYARLEKLKWYYEISALANYSIIDPFLRLPDEDLHLISDLNLKPPDKMGADASGGTYSRKWQRCFVQQKKDSMCNFLGEDDELVV
ncbi:hypothetical protein Tco_0831468 [Tanacetum coccineum]